MKWYPPHNLTAATRAQVESVLEYLESDGVYLTAAQEQDLYREIDSYLRVEGFKLLTRQLDNIQVGIDPNTKLGTIYKMSRYRVRKPYVPIPLFSKLCPVIQFPTQRRKY